MRSSIPGLRPQDMSRETSNPITGVNYAEALKGIIAERGLPEVRGPYLGLAAGSGNAEQALAQSFGLTDQMTLVDKIVYPENAGYIQADLFDFLTNWKGQPFGLVSLFGGGYIIESGIEWDKLWSALENATGQGSYFVAADLHELYPVPSSSSFQQEEPTRKAPVVNGIVAYRPT